MSRFIRPETTRLEISNGDWLVVKRRLSTGEQFAMFDRMMRPVTVSTDGRAPDVSVAPLEANMGQVLAYLVDWSLCDDDGKPVSIRGESADVVRSIVGALDPLDFKEILFAIQAHERAMLEERAKKKATSAGANGSLPTSPSPAAADGATNG